MTRGSLCIAVACLTAIPGAAHAQVCVHSVTSTGSRFFIEPVAIGARDTAVAVRLCLLSGPKGIGSYMASITYDSARMRVLRVDVIGGMQVANSRAAGTIKLAGASPNGFSSGPLAQVIFKVIGSKTLGRLRLVVSEATTPTGVSVMAETRAQGWPATSPEMKAVARPSVDSISPRTGAVDQERVTDLAVYGRGFTPAGNTVLFDGVEVTGLLSEDNGTVIRFAAPTRIPDRGNVPGHRVNAGRVAVRVRNSGGTSNPVTFTVRGGDL